MKKIGAMIGLATLVMATGIRADNTGDLDRTQSSKRWSANATMTYFYDDNYLTLPEAGKLASSGFLVRPAISYNLPGAQTYVGLSYTYGLQYFIDRPTNNIAHTHDFTAKIDHRLSSRSRLRLDESFSYAQEPDFSSGLAGGVTSIFNRLDSSYIHNSIRFTGNAQVSGRIGVELGLNNDFYEYESDLYKSLNRLEYGFSVNATWQLDPNTIPTLGYTFGIANYTAGTIDLSPTESFLPSVNDTLTHTFYLGLTHNFSPRLSAAIKIGASLTDFPNNPNVVAGFTPYIDASGTWSFGRKDSISLHVTHLRYPNSQAVATSASTDSENTGASLILTKAITQKLSAQVISVFQSTTYTASDTTFGGQSVTFLSTGLTLTYNLTRNWGATLGYRHDLNDTKLGNAYTRNYIFTGITASF